jgi:hypothetical protein
MGEAEELSAHDNNPENKEVVGERAAALRKFLRVQQEFVSLAIGSSGIVKNSRILDGI